jgi:predicted nucleic acid-binding protein
MTIRHCRRSIAAIALTLARALGADLVLIDDRAGVAVARRRGFTVTGTLGVLDLAARRGLIELGGAIARLKATNFRYRPEILDALLAQHRGEG